MDISKRRRGVLRGQITRIETYFKNLQSHEAVWEQINERLIKLVEIYNEFEIVQSEIERLGDGDDAEVQETERIMIEEKYFCAKSLGAKFLKELSRDNASGHVDPLPSIASDSSNTELSSAIRTLMDHQTSLAELVSRLPTTTMGSNTNQNINQNTNHSEIRLQPITVPSFNGNFQDWPEFYDLFRNLVHNNNRFSPAEKLQYLKRSLVGNAQGILKNITISDANYAEAYDELIKMFNKKEVIIDSYLQIIMDQQKIYTVSADALRSLCSNINESVRALKALGVPTDHWDRWLIFILCSKLDNESLKLWRRECAQKTEAELITFANLITFINNRIYELTPAKQAGNEYKQKRIESKGKYSHTTFMVNSCFMCQGEHGLYSCQKFLKLTIKARREFIQKKGLCFNCFRGKHLVKECTSKFMCKYCKGKHNTLLHQHKDGEKLNEATLANELNRNNNSIQKISMHSNTIKQFNVSTGILPTAVVLIKDSFNKFQKCRILLDTGSQVNIISEDCMQRLQLNRENARIAINGVGVSQVANTRGRVHIIIKSRFSDFQIESQAVILKRVTANIPTTKIVSFNNEFLQNIDLADPHYFLPAKIDMIIGSDIFFLILEAGKRCNGPGALMAQETKFGWIVSGQGSTDNLSHSISLHSCINIDQRLKSFWEIEELISKPLYTAEEEEAEGHFVENVKRNEEGRYIVRLPFKKDIDRNLGNSKVTALYTLKSLERRFAQNPYLKVEYTKFINEYLDLKHMKQITNNESNRPQSSSFYLPHHAVFKESSSTTKIRVVFDASRKTSNGISLNNLLLVGPTIQKDIWSMLVNFRKFKIAYTADITKMYRQIFVDNEDTPYQRILWRESVDDEIKEYELQTVTYGTASAPYLAIRCLKQLAIDEGNNHELGAKQLLENFYVDDFMSGSHCLEEALTIKNELIQLLAKGGFEIRKWSSNSEDFLSSINESDREVSFSLPLQEDTTVKVLGLRWHPAWDCFTFEVNLDQQIVYTKRNLLSEISKIYDPLGLLGPYIILAKMIMQQIWITGVNWDDQLSDEIIKKYKNFRNDLTLLSSFKIKRYLNITSKSLIQLCGFADASESAYAAVIYIRIVEDEQIKVSLLVSKTKVAPIKQVSLPRLELCAAHLLAKLMKKVITTMNFENADIYAFTDSTVVLAWLQAIPRKWKTFIANRTSEILDIIPCINWHHVKSSNNAADSASRGMLVKELIGFDLWWNGPLFLHTKEFNKMVVKISVDDTDLEQRMQPIVVHVTDVVEGESFSDLIFKKYSSLSKLTLIIAICKRFISNLKSAVSGNKVIKDNIFQYPELYGAMINLVKLSQKQDFGTDIDLLRRKQQLKKDSRLKALNPFIDKDGVLRVGGRLQEAKIGFSKKHPIILLKTHDLTKLIIQDIHNRYFHANQQLMLSLLTMKYWIIGCKAGVKKCVRNCSICMRYRMELYSQQMGNLPSYRVQPCRPFTNTGTDFAGPFMIRTWQGRGAKQLKCYIAIFVCMSTKALHIELVADLTTDKFLAALHRFVSRRGICSNIYSDNGRNFVGAARKLSEFQCFLRENHKNITQELAKNEISWHFIPAYSPNFGGIWESAVKSMKYHMKRAIGETVVTYDEMTTLLCQIEACLNSRPINIITMDADDPEPLTPGHFLVQGPILLPPQEIIDENMSWSTRWQLVQRMQLSFWKRWSNEYLSTLQQRKKWAKPAKNIQINDIVLIKEDNLPPCRWLMGRIIGTKPGRDELVRVATIKTKNGVIDRSIRKLIVFVPTDE